MDMLTPAQRLAIDRRLEPGERLLWATGASRGTRANAMLPGCAGIPLLLVGLWPLSVALRHTGHLFDERNGPITAAAFGGFGLLFVTAGLLALRHGVRLGRDMAAAVWAVTDRRFVRLVERDGRHIVRAVPLHLVTAVDLAERGDGSGTLTLTTGANPEAGHHRIAGVRDAAAARALIGAAIDRAAG